MRLPSFRTAVVLFAAALFPRAALAQTEEAAPVKPAANKGRLVAAEFCPFGTIGSPVGISVDDAGRVFVTETARRTNGELDIRKHMDYLAGTLASHIGLASTLMINGLLMVTAVIIGQVRLKANPAAMDSLRASLGGAP